MMSGLGVRMKLSGLECGKPWLQSPAAAQNWVWWHASVIPAVGDGGDVEVGEAYIEGHLSYLENLKLCVTMFFILFCFITK